MSSVKNVRVLEAGLETTTFRRICNITTNNVAMIYLKRQIMPAPPPREDSDQSVPATKRNQPFVGTPREIPKINRDLLMEASKIVGNERAPGVDEIPNITLKIAINAVQHYSYRSTIHD